MICASCHTIEMDLMMDNTENRKKVRFSHISSLQVKELRSGQIYEARMFNYSDNGIYFESDVVFQKGDKIYIGIQNSPYPNSPCDLNYYKGEVKWRKNLKRSFFSYGYGVQLLSDSQNQSLKSDPANSTKDSRRHLRKPFSRTVQFENHKGIFEGSTKNISVSGVFIATEEKLKVGQVIELKLPIKGKTAKIIGKIAWLNEEGFGLKFKKID
jgi:Tfp pilus assembly protein PilZ